MSTTLSPAKGARPASISNSTHPNAQTIGARVDRSPFGLFRRHIGRSPEDDACCGHRWRGDRHRLSRASILESRVERLRQPKIQHLDDAVIANLDVRGLEVAMDDALLVCRFERVRDLLPDWNRFVERQRTPRDAIGKRRPSTSSITRANVPPAFSTPKMWAMFGWLSAARTSASR
jgi:hypothetical protein